MGSFSDDFNRADENPLSGGSNWSTTPYSGLYDRFQIVSNQLRGTLDATNNHTAQSVAAFTPTDDQWAQVTLVTLTAGRTAGVILHAAAPPTVNFYILEATSTNDLGFTTKISVLSSPFSGVTITSESSSPWSNGDVLYAQVSGNNFTIKRGGSEGTIILTGSDSTYPSGRIGAFAYVVSTSDIVLDNFSGGDLVTVTPLTALLPADDLNGGLA